MMMLCCCVAIVGCSERLSCSWRSIWLRQTRTEIGFTWRTEICIIITMASSERETNIEKYPFSTHILRFSFASHSAQTNKMLCLCSECFDVCLCTFLQFESFDFQYLLDFQRFSLSWPEIVCLVYAAECGPVFTVKWDEDGSSVANRIRILSAKLSTVKPNPESTTCQLSARRIECILRSRFACLFSSFECIQEARIIVIGHHGQWVWVRLLWFNSTKLMSRLNKWILERGKCQSLCLVHLKGVIMRFGEFKDETEGTPGISILILSKNLHSTFLKD